MLGLEAGPIGHQYATRRPGDHSASRLLPQKAGRRPQETLTSPTAATWAGDAFSFDNALSAAWVSLRDR